MDRFDVAKGTALAVVVTLKDADGNAITTYAGTEGLSAALWPGNSEDATAQASCAWVTPGAGLVSVTLADTVTAGVAPGEYSLRLVLTSAGVAYDAYEALVTVLPSAGAAASTVNVPAKPAGATLYSTSPTYCTDEDVAVRAAQDFFALATGFVCKGTDGATGGWALTSPSVDFLAVGLAAGNVVQLSGPRSAFNRPELYAVDSVAANVVWLRRPGRPANSGQPPPAVSGVTFEVRTYAPQIDNASYDAKKFFGVDEALPCRTSARLYDPRELQQYTVLTVLRRAYISADKAAASDYDLKLGLVTTELSELTARLVLHWGQLAQGEPPTTRFGTRISR
jgi:hypothetical protein